MDLNMPIMNGLEAFMNLKKIKSDCKVFISSGYIDDEEITLLKENGISGFMSKPYNIKEISKLLKDIL